jgi:hypothetical protein
MNYADNTTFLAQYAGDSGYATNADFLAMLPIWITSAEQRILRDMDLLSTRVSDTSGALAPNSRLFTLPTGIGTFTVVETVSLKMSYTNGITGTLFTQPPLTWVSKDALDAMYPDDHAVGNPSSPQWVAPYGRNLIAVGPAPSAAYPVVVYGTQDPATLSEDNTETFISTELPDLMLAAEMIDVSAWQRKFGAMSDDPAQARDWNQEYERLMKAANVEALRLKLQGAGWSSRQPNPLQAQP